MDQARDDGTLLHALLLQRGHARQCRTTDARQGRDEREARRADQRQELLLLAGGQLRKGRFGAGHRQGDADAGDPLHPRPRPGGQEPADHLHVQHRRLPDGHRCQVDFPGRCRQGGNRREIRTGHGRHADREAERHDRRQRPHVDPRSRDPRIRHLQHRLGAGRLELQRIQGHLPGVLARRKDRLHRHLQQTLGPLRLRHRNGQ